MKSVWLAGMLTIVALGGLPGPAAAQDQTERVTVSFSDPSRPGTLTVNLVIGSVDVKASERRDVLIEARGRTRQPDTSSRPDRPDPAAAGLRRLNQRGSFTVEEVDNVMKITRIGASPPVDFTVHVPLRTNLKISLVNGGMLSVEGVEGDIEASNVNGPVTISNVAGSVVAHSTNGKVVATMTRVTAQKAMAFTSLNGGVDVTLPSAVKANVKLRSDHGDVFTDYEIQLTAPGQPQPPPGDRQDGRYRIEVDRAIYGTINSGGPEVELRTFNGNVYLRRGK